MQRFTRAKLIETATFVVIFAIPPAIAEAQTSLPWWAILSLRLFFIALNAWTLLYCERFGAWLAGQFSALSCKRVSELAAVLFMQLPITFGFLWVLNQGMSQTEQSLRAPMLIATGFCLVMWAFEEWGRNWLQRHLPWLARLAQNPLETAVSTARGMAHNVARGGRDMKRRITERGSKPQ